MRSFLAASAAALAFSAGAVAQPAAAQIAPGSTLIFSGTADATDVGLGGVVLDFTKHVVAASSGNTGAFASLNTRGNGATGKIADVRVGNGPEYIANFLQFGGYKFTLFGLPSGPYGQDACYVDPVPGQTCTPYQSVQGNPMVNAGLSPFYVANTASIDPTAPINSTAAFDVFGTVSGPGGAMSLFTGTIASSFVGLPYQYVLYTLEQQGLQGLNFTGTFTTGPGVLAGAQERATLAGTVFTPDATVTPEPATLGLVAVGFVGAMAAARRGRRA